MSWMLNVAGQIPHGEAARELEHRLVAELQAVLSKPEYGAATSWFRGVHAFSSDVHRAPNVEAPAEVKLVPEPSEVAPAKPASVRGSKAAAGKATEA